MARDKSLSERTRMNALRQGKPAAMPHCLKWISGWGGTPRQRGHQFTLSWAGITCPERGGRRLLMAGLAKSLSRAQELPYFPGYRYCRIGCRGLNKYACPRVAIVPKHIRRFFWRAPGGVGSLCHFATDHSLCKSNRTMEREMGVDEHSIR